VEVQLHGKTYVIRLRRDDTWKLQLQITRHLTDGGFSTIKEALVLDVSDNTVLFSDVKKKPKKGFAGMRIQQQKSALRELQLAHPMEYAQAERLLELEVQRKTLTALKEDKELAQHPSALSKLGSILPKLFNKKAQQEKIGYEKLLQTIADITQEITELTSNDTVVTIRNKKEELKEGIDGFYEMNMKENMTDFQNEVIKGLLFTKLGLPHVLPYIGATKKKTDYTQEEAYTSVINKFCRSGDATRLFSTTPLTLDQQAERLRIFIQIATGLEAIHHLDICVTDLKPHNIFLSTEEGRLHAWLADFGGTIGEHEPLGAITPNYTAPERKFKSPVAKSGDIWALGLILFTFFHGEKPKIRKAEDIAPDLVPGNPIDTFIASIVKNDPNSRPTISDLLPQAIGLLHDVEEQIEQGGEKQKDKVKEEELPPGTEQLFEGMDVVDKTDEVEEKRGTDQATETIEGKVDEVANGVELEGEESVELDIADLDIEELPDMADAINQPIMESLAEARSQYEATVDQSVIEDELSDSIPEEPPDHQLPELFESLSEILQGTENQTVLSKKTEQIEIKIPEQYTDEAAKEYCTSVFQNIQAQVSTKPVKSVFKRLWDAGKIVFKSGDGKVVLGGVEKRTGIDAKEGIEAIEQVKQNELSQTEETKVKICRHNHYLLKKLYEIKLKHKNKVIIDKLDTEIKALELQGQTSNIFKLKDKALFYDIPSDLIIFIGCETDEDRIELSNLFFKAAEFSQEAKELVKGKLANGDFKNMSKKRFGEIDKDAQKSAIISFEKISLEIDKIIEEQKKTTNISSTQLEKVRELLGQQPNLDRARLLAHSMILSRVFRNARLTNTTLEAEMLEQMREQDRQFAELIKALDKEAHNENVRIFKEELKRFESLREYHQDRKRKQEMTSKKRKRKQPRAVKLARGA